MQRIESAVWEIEAIEPEEWDRVQADAARQVSEVMDERWEIERMIGKLFREQAAVAEPTGTERRDAIRDLHALGLATADGSELTPFAQTLLHACYPDKYQRPKSARNA